MTKDSTTDSNKKLKIAFVWYFNKASWIFDNWRDGLRSALEEIEKKHLVGWFLDETIPDPNEDWDFILIWSDSNCPFFDRLDKYKARKGLCLTTMPQNFDNLRKLDVVFCESTPVFDAVRSQGIRAIKAFGTDTSFFKPSKIKKDIDFFYPATFSPWKKQSEIAYLGSQLLCVGTIQPDGIQEVEACKQNGVKLEIGYFPVKTILNYYQRSKNIIIPAVHGSERTVLESMACGIQPAVIHPENFKTYSYLVELEQSGLSPRKFVVNNYSHKVYAKELLKGIEQ